MRKTLLILALVPGLASGCTSMMWKDGFATETTATGVSYATGYRPPNAVKGTNGDVTVDYDARRYRLTMLGREPDQSKWKLQRMTNRVSPADLQCFTNWFKVQVAIYPPALNAAAFVQPGQALPFLQAKLLPDMRVKYPDRECLLDENDLIWYVPPHHAGELPMAAPISKDTKKNSTAYLPVKVVLTPVTVCEDILALPAYAFVKYAFRNGV